MRFSTSIPTLAIALVTSIVVAACGDPARPPATATVSGVVRAATGAVIEGASVKIGSATATTGADGRFELQNLPVGSATIITSAPNFDQRSESVSLVAGANVHDVVLTPGGEWGLRANMLENNSEFALAESNGKLYVLGGYPPGRQTVRTVQIYDIATDRWVLGPPLPVLLLMRNWSTVGVPVISTGVTTPNLANAARSKKRELANGLDVLAGA